LRYRCKAAWSYCQKNCKRNVLVLTSLRCTSAYSCSTAVQNNEQFLMVINNTKEQLRKSDRFYRNDALTDSNNLLKFARMNEHNQMVAAALWHQFQLELVRIFFNEKMGSHRNKRIRLISLSKYRHFSTCLPL
jgi:hypothetical protein